MVVGGTDEVPRSEAQLDELGEAQNASSQGKIQFVVSALGM